MSRPACAAINLQVLQHNPGIARQHAGTIACELSCGVTKRVPCRGY
ncbi:MAG: hypothetical protein PVF75_08715 [Granulosicoccaceae bacterium]|jgi:hypothetical protein